MTIKLVVLICVTKTPAQYTLSLTEGENSDQLYRKNSEIKNIVIPTH